MKMFPRLTLFTLIFSCIIVLTVSTAVIKEEVPETVTLTNDTQINASVPTESYYELLNLRTDANSRQIKAAYRKLAVKAHPDKYNDPIEKEKANEKFMRIAQAYDVLGNDIKRKLYDAMLAKGMLDFDESKYWDLMGDKMKDDGPVEITIWDVPYVESMSDDTVLFICGLGTLIMIAIPIYQNFVGAPKKKTKLDVKKDLLSTISHKKKQEDRRRVEEARLKTIMDELSDDDDDDEIISPAAKKTYKGEMIADPVAQKQRELKRQEQQKKKRFRAILKTICKPYTIGAREEAGSPKSSAALRMFKDDEVQFLVRELNVNDLEILVNDMVRALGRKEYSDDDIIATYEQVLNAYKIFQVQINKIQSQKTNISIKTADKKKKNESIESTAWSHAEESTLAKAMAKFPGGVGQRWEKITELVNTVGKRTEKEVLKKAKELENASLKKTDADAFEVYQENLKKGSNGTSAHDDNVWSTEQQSAFENALKNSKNVDAGQDKWSVIASSVPGKTRDQCQARYKFIRDQLAAKK